MKVFFKEWAYRFVENVLVKIVNEERVGVKTMHPTGIVSWDWTGDAGNVGTVVWFGICTKEDTGAAVLPKISGMAFGDDGSVLVPAEGQIGLRHELYRKAVDGYSFVGDTVCRYECTLSETELAGEDINEIGLFDEEGDIVCIPTFKNKGKDEDLEMTFQIEDEF